MTGGITRHNGVSDTIPQHQLTFVQETPATRQCQHVQSHSGTCPYTGRCSLLLVSSVLKVVFPCCHTVVTELFPSETKPLTTKLAFAIDHSQHVILTIMLQGHHHVITIAVRIVVNTINTALPIKSTVGHYSTGPQGSPMHY